MIAKNQFGLKFGQNFTSMFKIFKFQFLVNSVIFIIFAQVRHSLFHSVEGTSSRCICRNKIYIKIVLVKLINYTDDSGCIPRVFVRAFINCNNHHLLFFGTFILKTFCKFGQRAHLFLSQRWSNFKEPECIALLIEMYVGPEQLKRHL